MLEAVLFDFDGTLVPSLDYWLSGFKHAFAELGHEVSEQEIIEGCFYKDDSLVAEAFGIESHKTFWQLVQHKIVMHYDSAALVPGAREVLDFCRERNLPLALVTSSEKPVIERAFEVLDLASYFNSVVTADDVVNLKPHPEPVLKALAELGVQAEKALFIGDYVVDVKAGRAAGVTTAIYFADDHKRFHDPSHIEASGPDFMFASYSELLGRLEKDLAARTA